MVDFLPDPPAFSRSSLRSPSQASPRLPPGSSCLAGLWGNRGRSPYRMCRSLSRILQIFHSFSSRAVGAVFVATSLRHFAPVPPGVVSAASAELPPGFLPGVVGPRRTLSFSARLRQVSEGPWGNRGRSPYRMCRSLSRIFMQIFHSFSSRAVGAVFVATSLRHFASFPFLRE